MTPARNRRPIATRASSRFMVRSLWLGTAGKFGSRAACLGGGFTFLIALPRPM